MNAHEATIAVAILNLLLARKSDGTRYEYRTVDAVTRTVDASREEVLNVVNELCLRTATRRSDGADLIGLIPGEA